MWVGSSVQRYNHFVMVSAKDNSMGRFSVEVELANNDDVRDLERGRLAPDKVRRVRIRGVVDSGATRLVIPESVAKHLGLRSSSRAQGRNADGRAAQREIVKGIHLAFGDRSSVFNAIVEPGRESARL